MLKALKKESFEPCEIPYRQNEKYYVLCPDAGSIQVLFGVHFTNPDEVALAKQMLNELAPSCNRVDRAINVRWRDPKEGVPKEITDKFPNTKVDISNGWVAMSKSLSSIVLTNL